MDSLPDITEKLSAFKARVLPAESVLIAAHDFPDPDCLAAAEGISHLLKFWGAGASVTAYGGFVGREENRAMVRLLGFSAVPIHLVDWGHFDRVIVVDTVPGSGNLSLPEDVSVDAVFDHHLEAPKSPMPYYWDIRGEIGATSTLVTMYLLAAGCPIPVKLATGLFYGIKTDTRDMGRDAYPEDLACYKILFDLMDHQLLSHIEHPERDPEFFEALYRASSSISLCGDVAQIYLGKVATPDHVGEMADFFHSLKTVEWTLCSGLFKGNFFFSIRSKTSDDAGKIAREIARSCEGGGGGHGKIGAGRIPVSRDRDMFGLFKKNAKKILGVALLPEKPLLRKQTHP